MISNYPRETVEFLFITVKVGGVEVLTDVTVCVVRDSARPEEWVEPVSLDGKMGVLITDLTPGYYKVWAKVASDPESPVIHCGAFRVS